MLSPNFGAVYCSPRKAFQWYHVYEYLASLYFVDIPHWPTNGDGKGPSILNVGSANDPIGFGELAHHFDVDDWSHINKRFTRGDAHQLPFPDRSWDLVILGDILEHVSAPITVVDEACRVANRRVVLTVFEEWRLPGRGQWVKEGQALADSVARSHGFENRMVEQLSFDPAYKGYDDDAIPHLIHINQFTDDDISAMILLVGERGYTPLSLYKYFEAEHEGHNIFNWLLAFERTQP